MKKFILIICVVFVLSSCNENSVAKPDNLITKDKMIDILYDISLLEAIKVQNLKGGINRKKANEFIYKKYKIDSIQFAKSNKYYASDLVDYKKMFEKVKDRLNKENAKVEAEMKKKGIAIPQNPNSTRNSDTPQVQ
ncbi:DUF4296 domain-containing protein [Flavobacterium sp.]|uniref:DUF4296 domain-containing protein n=1 Tax=Flavobacterium sp. TaxID=239 RepID=UPI002489D26A|nr:DUF4296 domain-containing protein [Flavobacterium sp.]MDI1316304.1 DUF4296 domain-containing protein [Flavobacterium sp.]